MKREKILLGLADFSFVVHALPAGALGVAWPSLRATFDLPLDALGTLLLITTSGYLVSGFAGGRVITRFGIGPVLVFSWFAGAIGVAGYAFAPSWPWLLAAALVVGAGGGLADPATNTYVAAQFQSRQMNWLHACFGLGAALGPLLMSRVLVAGLSWERGYLLIAVLHLLVAVLMLVTVRAWQPDAAQAAVQEAESRYGRTLRQPTMLLSMLLFFLYVGVETTAGQWSYTLFTEGRHIPEAVAGTWITLYWGSLTVGRLLVGVVVTRWGNGRTLRLGMGGVLLGAVLLAVPVNLLGFAGLALLGFSAAPIFPVLTSETPQRVGALHAANAVGFQIGSGSLGLALQPGLAGLLADTVGLEIIGPFLAATALMMWLVYERMARMVPARYSLES